MIETGLTIKENKHNEYTQYIPVSALLDLIKDIDWGRGNLRDLHAKIVEMQEEVGYDG